MTGPPAVVLDDVTVVVGGRVVLDGVDLEVAAREQVALVGPSGSGKSTLLRVVAGLIEPDAGTVHVGGRWMAGVAPDGPGSTSRAPRPVPPERRGVGMVFQDHALFPHLTVAGNVAFGLAGRPKAQRRTRVDEVLHLVHAESLAERRPHELSGGEAQRVALARALAPEPAVVLLDEPFASLDPDLRHTVRAEVAEVLRQAGTAAVLVTHDHEEAFALGRRVARLDGGRLVAVPAAAPAASDGTGPGATRTPSYDSQ